MSDPTALPDHALEVVRRLTQAFANVRRPPDDKTLGSLTPWEEDLEFAAYLAGKSRDDIAADLQAGEPYTCSGFPLFLLSPRAYLYYLSPVLTTQEEGDPLPGPGPAMAGLCLIEERYEPWLMNRMDLADDAQRQALRSYVERYAAAGDRLAAGYTEWWRNLTDGP